MLFILSTLQVLLDTALMHAKRNTSCLEPCLRQLSLALNQPYNVSHKYTCTVKQGYNESDQYLIQFLEKEN